MRSKLRSMASNLELLHLHRARDNTHDAVLARYERGLIQ